jgi:hypothetical protein
MGGTAIVTPTMPTIASTERSIAEELGTRELKIED